MSEKTERAAFDLCDPSGLVSYCWMSKKKKSQPEESLLDLKPLGLIQVPRGLHLTTKRFIKQEAACIRLHVRTSAAGFKLDVWLQATRRHSI